MYSFRDGTTKDPGRPMPKLNYLLSLPTDDNDYQQEQATAAKETAQRLGLDLQVVYADNDAIKQSDQILKAIQSPAGARPRRPRTSAADLDGGAGRGLAWPLGDESDADQRIDAQTQTRCAAAQW